MADSLRSRISQIIIGSVHALVDQAEEQAPEPIVEQTIGKIDCVTHEVREELSVITVNRHLTQRHRTELQRRHQQLTLNAEEAIAQQRDDLAYTAVTRQLVIEGRLLLIERNLLELASQEQELAGYIEALAIKRQEMEQLLTSYRLGREYINTATSRRPETGSPG